MGDTLRSIRKKALEKAGVVKSNLGSKEGQKTPFGVKAMRAKKSNKTRAKMERGSGGGRRPGIG